MRRLAVTVLLVLSFGLAMSVAVAPAGAVALGSATASCGGDGGNYGARLLGAAWPGGFTGVPVYSNGPASSYDGGCQNSAATPSGKKIVTGTKWQCTELVNRLYAVKGWISATWQGNGGRSSPTARDSMYDMAPKSLAKEPNGSISQLVAGDVVSINVYTPTGAFEPDGHVLVVSQVSGSTVTYVSQNAGTNTTTTVTTTGTLSGGKLTVRASGKWTYTVIGVVEAPGSTHSWKASAVPLPANAGSGGEQIEATSCPSASKCVAVGYYTDTSGNQDGLLLTLSGGTWTAAEAPAPANAAINPGGEGPYLEAVSCPSVSECVAVGQYEDSSTSQNDGLLLTWSGGTWTAAEAPVPANAYSGQTSYGNGAYLDAVSCPSSSECVAGGAYPLTSTSEYSQPMLLTWSGAHWTAQESPVPPDAATGNGRDTGGGVSAVTCPSSSVCAADGWYWTGSGYEPEMVLSWTGGAWTATKAPLPANAADSSASWYPQQSSQLSCASVSKCIVGGSYDDSSGANDGLLLTWSGSTWTAAEAPLPANSVSGDAWVLGVSCPSASECVADGQYTDASTGGSDGLLLTWSGSTWTATEAHPGAWLEPVSCPSVSVCAAAGAYADSSSNTVGLLAAWSGGTWRSAEAPLPPNAASAPGTQDVSIRTLSCPSESECVATGEYTDTSGNQDGLLLTGSG